MRFWNFKGEQNSISDALRLSLPGHAVISIAGAGGKTSLMSALGWELASQGRRTVVTTTTHLMHPDHIADRLPAGTVNPYDGIPAICSAASSDEIIQRADLVLKESGLVMIVTPDPEKPTKVSAPPEPVLEYFYETADAVIIEADGAKCMPFKWPAPWEPAIPERTDVTIYVAGLTALGKRPEDVMFRYQKLPEPYQREIVDEKLISAVIASPEGGQKGAQGEFRAYLNQADDEAKQQAAARIQRILSVYGVQSAWGTFL